MIAWRRLPGPLKLIVGLVAFCAVVLVGSAVTGGDKDKVTTGAVRPLRTPQACLQQAHLSEVSRRGPATWRGFHPGPPFFDVFVDQMDSPAAAVNASAEADLVWSFTAGRYVVTGPSKETDDGGVVADVADCLVG